MVTAFPHKAEAKERRNRRTTASAIFQPFRAIGYVTSDVPLFVQARGNVHAITTSVGNSFHIYDGEKLNLLFTGPQTGEVVSAVAAFKDRIFSACGAEISVAERGKEIARLSSDSTNKIFSLILFGNLLLALCEDNVVRIWNHATGEFYSELEFPGTFRVTTAVHPSTYLNKIVFGSQQGTMQLWNLRTLRMLYEFKPFPSPITFVTQAPAVDVVAVGLLDGTIIMHNIRVDVEIMRLKQEGKVTAVSFRTDDKPHMVTGNIAGDVAIWDLDKRQVLHVMKGAHEGTVHSAHYFSGQPILITAGSDNALRQWIFDSAEGIPRLLRSRGGHRDPPTRIRYHPVDHSQIISAGNDQALRLFSVTRDSKSLEVPFGDKKGKGFIGDDVRIPGVAHFDASEETSTKAINVITAHIKDALARTCSFGGRPITKRTYSCTDNSLVKSVAISACGNFGLLGSALGRIDRFNLQSGLLRKTYGDKQGGHTKAVVSIVTDRVNRIVASGSLDGTVKFWAFQTGALMETVTLPASVGSMILHRESGLVAVAADDCCLRIIDMATMKIVREFRGHRSHITDMCFSPDARLLVSSSVDATIRTWDLPTGYMVDLFRVNSVPRTVTFSPTGDFLATAHADHIGIFLWVNRMQFMNVPFRNLTDEDLVEVELPKTGEEEREMEGEQEAKVDMEELPKELPTGEVVDDQLIMLSGLPKIRWQNLLSLDALRKRSKPAEAPKAERAPFFLPSLRDLEKTFGSTKIKDEDEEQSRVKRLPDLELQPEFLRLLREGHAENNYSDVMKYILDLTPSAIDLTLRTMTMGDHADALDLFLDALTWQLENRRDFEAVESCLNLLLKIHAEELVKPGVRERINGLLKRHRESWEILEGMFQYGLCLLDFVKT